MSDRATDRHARVVLRRATALGGFDPQRALALGVIEPDEVEDVTAAWPGRRPLMSIRGTPTTGWQGRFLEDFVVGDVYRHAHGRTITQADNTWFTLLTNNTHDIHYNVDYASRTEFGKPLVVSHAHAGHRHRAVGRGREPQRRRQPGLGACPLPGAGLRG